MMSQVLHILFVLTHYNRAGANSGVRTEIEHKISLDEEDCLSRIEPCSWPFRIDDPEQTFQ